MAAAVVSMATDITTVSQTTKMTASDSNTNLTTNSSVIPPPYKTVSDKDFERHDFYPDYYDGAYTGYNYEYHYNYSKWCQSEPEEDTLPPGYKLCMHILLPIICSIGIVGIILTILVLSRKNMSTSTNSYLISLAVVDLFFLLFMIGKVVESKLSMEQYVFFIIMTYMHIVLEILLLASVWLTVMLAVERYIAICHPMKAMSICSVVRARIIIGGIFLFAVACRFPKFFRHRVVPFHHPCFEETVYELHLTEFGQNLTYNHVYGWVVNCFFSAIIPFSILLFLNGCLIREIHRSTNYLRYHLAIDSNVQTIITSEEVKITMMLISVIIVFFICQAPYFVLMALTSIAKFSNLFKHFHIIRNVTILLLALRSSFNFILYCWFSEKFWNTFKRTFCVPSCISSRTSCWLSTRVNGNHSEPNYSNNNPVQDQPMKSLPRYHVVLSYHGNKKDKKQQPQCTTQKV